MRVFGRRHALASLARWGDFVLIFRHNPPSARPIPTVFFGEQAAVVHEFAPRFAPGSKVLYLGDTAKKNLYVDDKTLADLGIPITEHDKLPDIVLFDSKKKWLFLIEVVTSHGPMSPKRVIELGVMLKNCKVGKVFVTAFPNFTEFRKHTPEIAWETEVWLADIPDHMIHYNGDKFFGPR
ncbi:hypothetical protein KKB64_04375 [Patescibacteria group bacterium]|nr:hypothetical protein [Patescibacteria group bacterium]MBU2459947.1 hypothetical protein [Patescibacteria group bacterium]MBU2544793.1 hypothetical protein [Patescibacteria group bacterium]